MFPRETGGAGYGPDDATGGYARHSAERLVAFSCIAALAVTLVVASIAYFTLFVFGSW